MSLRSETEWYIVDVRMRRFKQLYELHRALLFIVFRKVLLKFVFDVLNMQEYTTWLTNAPADHRHWLSGASQ